jgi:hypothetical protein
MPLNKNGKTALHLEIEKDDIIRSLDLIKAFVEHGADASISLQMLINRMAYDPVRKLFTYFTSDFEIVKCLLKFDSVRNNKATPEILSSNNNAIFNIACSLKDDELMFILYNYPEVIGYWPHAILSTSHHIISKTTSLFHMFKNTATEYLNGSKKDDNEDKQENRKRKRDDSEDKDNKKPRNI